MERELTFEEALMKCQFLAAKSECCEYDLVQKMQRWNVPHNVITQVIDSLVEEKFVDNLRFAIAYVRDKTRFNHWGRIKTTMMLRQKRVQQSIIDQAFAELPAHDYFKAFDFEKCKKLKQLKNLPPFEQRRKTASYLIQRGFEPDYVFKEL